LKELKSIYNKKNVLIIGGAGFIGSNLAIKLKSLGAKISIADIFHPMYGGNKYNLSSIINDIEFSFTDLRDEYGLQNLINDKDYIFNLAAQVSYTDSMLMPYFDLDINCNGHLKFLEICKEKKSEASILFTSSRMVYGKPMTVPVSENHPTNPLSLYATHKLTAEKYYTLYNHFYGLDTKIVRIANPYGPRNQMKNSKYGIVNWFIRLAMENKDINVFGDGSQMRDYIYIDDIVNGILVVASINKSNSSDIIYNLGSGKGCSFNNMVDEILNNVGSGSKRFVPWPENYEKNETGDFIADIGKITNLLGKDYTFTDLKDGINSTYLYYRDNSKFYF